MIVAREALSARPEWPRLARVSIARVIAPTVQLWITALAGTGLGQGDAGAEQQEPRRNEPIGDMHDGEDRLAPARR